MHVNRNKKQNILTTKKAKTNMNAFEQKQKEKKCL